MTTARLWATGQIPVVTPPSERTFVRHSQLHEPPVLPPLTVVGVADDRLDLLYPEARQALVEAEVVVGARRHLRLWQSWSGRPAVGPGGWAPETIEVGADVEELARTLHQRAMEASRRVCVLASGDPGFFGILRALERTIDRQALRVLPAPSPVSLAFARLRLPWDDAMVVSAHGRPLAELAGMLRTASKAAVLTTPASPPEAVGQALVDAGAVMDLVAVCNELGSPGEQVRELTLVELASGRFDPLSVLVLLGPGRLPLVGWAPGHPRQATGTGAMPAKGDVRTPSDSALSLTGATSAHAEVHSVVLGKLALPTSGVLWDLGTEAGSIAIESSLLRPRLTVLAVEESPDDSALASANALALGAGAHVVTGRVPEVLGGLPSPDRVVVGGDDLGVIDVVLERLRPGGRVVATFAAIDQAAAAANRLGNLVQIGVGRGERQPGGGWQLTARNPVFVVWGP